MRSFKALGLILFFAIASFIGSASPAHALPSDTKGWCTVVAPGTAQCGFDTPLAACIKQHSVYAPQAIFYGYKSNSTKWYIKLCQWKPGIGIILPTIVVLECTDPFLFPDSPSGCHRPPQDDCGQNKGGTPTGATENPIDLVSGTKRFRAVDFQTADGALRLARSYSSLAWAGTPNRLADRPLGLANWQFDFQVELQIGDEWEAAKSVAVTFPNGIAIGFTRQTNGTMAPNLPLAYPRPQTDYTLTFNDVWPTDLNTIRNAKTHWALRDASDNVWSLETFADPATGQFTVARPKQIVYRNGLTLTFAYGASYQLTSITDSFGKQISFTWNMIDPTLVGGTGPAFPAAIKEALLPGNYKLKYTYDTIGANTSGLPYSDRLTKVELVNPSNVVQDSTTYQYGDPNFKNGVTAVLDKNAVVRWNVTYDADGRATVSEGPSSADRMAVAYTPIATSFTRTVTNALGKAAIYNYTSGPFDLNVKLTSVAGQASANCPASTGTLAYTGSLVTSRTDEEGRVTTYTRNAKAQVTQMVEASGTPLARTTTYTWHATLSLPTQIVRPGLTTDLTYDAQGRLLTRTETDTTTQTVPYSTNGQTRTWTFTWSTGGQLLTADGPLAGVTDKTTYTYSLNGYLATVKNGLNQTTTINTVNWRGLPTQVTDPNSVVTNFVYDDLGRVTSVTVNPGASQAVTSFQYNAVGQVTQLTLPNSVVLTYAYNDAKRLTSITNAANEKIEYVYDAMGGVTEVDTKNASAVIVQQVRQSFDELGRTLKLIGAANQQTQFAYDKVDNNTQITDPRSKVYGNTFDELNRLKRQTDPDTFQTNMAFTGRDDVASVTDARTNATTYVRNGWGDIIRETSPDRGITDYVYDARGLMTQRTDARGQVTNFAYDGLSRMTSRSFPGASAETITWTYDSTLSGNKGVGRLTGVTDPSGSAAYTYNPLGQRTRVVRVTGGRTYQTDYVYDKAGNVTQITMPSGRIVTYTRDSLARVTAVATKDNAVAVSNTVVSSATWRPFGPLASMTFGNSIALTLGYDNDGRVTGINAAGGGTTVQNLTYGYDLASNIASIGDGLNANRSQTFVYDNLNRLTSATGLYGTNTYAYDAVGNRTQKTVTVPFASTDTYTTPANSNRLASISGGTSRSLSYEASGQASSDQRSPVDNWSYTNDKAGRMAAAIVNSVTQASFAYDGDELRIRKTNTVSGAITHYIFGADGQLLAEMNGTTGAVIREYIWLGALPIGYVDRLGASGASRLFFIHADHLARPQKITDSSRAVVWDGVFAPFGEIHSITGSIVNVLMFPGQVYDPETGLSQNWNRDYDANIGRYLQSDPIGLEGGFNTYAYVGGNPTVFIDPDGTFGIGGAVFGAGLDLALQLAANGGRLECVNWSQVAMSAALGAIGGGWFTGLFKHSKSGLKAAEAAWNWSAASRRIKRAQGLASKTHLHHWGIPQGGWGKAVPDVVKNHPWNLKAMEAEQHRWLHSNRSNFWQRWWYGTPDWAKQAEAGLAGAAILPGASCECESPDNESPDS